HWHPPRGTLFITFRLAHTVPKAVLRSHYSERLWLDQEARQIARLGLPDDSPELKIHQARLHAFNRRWFSRFEKILHKIEAGQNWLKDDALAAVVAEALHKRDGEVYRLDAYCIMPNHVHVVFGPFLSEDDLTESLGPSHVEFLSEHQTVGRIMQPLKG